MLLKITTFLTIAATATHAFQCPHEYGFYPHPTSCDKYYKCENNQPELKTCGNGLAFDAADPKFLTENCDYLHNVECGERTQLEPPIGSKNCPRLYGIFHDEARCDTFWSCWNGEANKYTCAPGLAYDKDARVCMWADQVEGCRQKDRQEGDDDPHNGFKCPALPSPTGTFSRHAHPEDCRKYYVCLDGNPREYGCPIGTVYKIGSDDYSGQCEDPEGVTGCENYYGDELKNYKKSDLLLGNYQGDHSDNSKSTTRRPVVRKKVVVAKDSSTIVANKEVVVVKGGGQGVVPVARPAGGGGGNKHGNGRRQQLRASAQTTTTTLKTTTTTTTTTPAPKDDEYYYYDENYDVPTNAAGNTKQ